MKKILVMLLALVLSLGVAAQALADSGKPAGAQQGNGQAKHAEFKDIEKHWAAKEIKQMSDKNVVKGYLDGTFRPSNVVSNLEAIVMIVRAADIGPVTDADDIDLDELKHVAKIPVWAAGYIQSAIDADILLEGEFAGFQPNQAAKRMEVARWLYRAYVNEDDEDDDADVMEFLDDQNIPDAFRGYVAAMAKHKIMIGDNNHRFQPNKAVTRAEMMVILSRLYEGFEWTAQRYVQGYIVSVESDEITVESSKWDDDKTFDLADEPVIYVDGDKTTDLDDLEEGMHVRLVLNIDGEVIFVRANSVDEDDEDEEDDADYQGRITDLYTDDDEDFVTIRSGNRSYTFEVTAETDIETPDEEVAEYEDLRVGDMVEIEVDGDEAVSIVVEEDEEDENDELSGEITDIDYDDDTVSIDLHDGDVETYDVNSFTDYDVEDVNDDNDEDFDDLQDGDEVEFIVLGDLITKIEVVELKEHRGVIVSVDEEDDYFWVDLVGGDNEKFYVDEDTDVDGDDGENEFADLVAGDNVEFQAVDHLVLEIEVNN